MDEFKEFFETSTIGGLTYIVNTRLTAKLFWIVIVLSSFTASFIEIWNLFQDWEKNPIKTTTENLPISQLSLPNVTVCPKNFFLNLNHDIMESEKVSIDEETRQELLEYAVEVVQDDFYAEIMRNLSKVEDPNRFKNWYRGYNRILYSFFQTYPYQVNRMIGVEGDQDGVTFTVDNSLWYFVHTSATSGNLTTKHFGQYLDEEKAERDIFFVSCIVIPQSAKTDANVKLMLKVKKVSILSDDKRAEMSLNYIDPIANTLNDWQFNLSVKSLIESGLISSSNKNIENECIQLINYVKLSDYDFLKNIQKKMPGFSFSWSYDRYVEPFAAFRTYFNNFIFIR